ncbi:MAG TPA: glycosyltransferase family 2 protein [Gemmatimonadales bacterium]|nr:glycosyltransferase family 2 protein [Gemmatimonadales bacterium]
MTAHDDLELGCHSCHTTRRNDRRRALWRWGNRLQEQVVRLEGVVGRMRHRHGPARPDIARDELVVLCVGRDVEAWIGEFLEHHLALGAAHVVLLDNASEDDTVAIASRFPRVTVFTSALPFGHLEVGMRRWLTRTFAADRWSLYCDADELWDYPGSDRLPLRGFLDYLERHGYKAVTGQMLDLFADRPFSELPGAAGASLRGTYRWYDLADLVPTRDVYWIRDGQLDSAAIVCNFGGIRKRFFGDDCLLLTKHPLVFADRTVGLYTYDGHFVTGARVADVSTVLLHYKYVPNLPDRARKSVDWVNPELYRGLSRVLAENPTLCLKTASARELRHVDELVANGFLVVSERYREWLAARAGALAMPRR